MDRRLFFLAAASAMACHFRPPAVRFASAHEIGVVGQSPLIVGRDGGWGARLWGHEVFVFGDTFVSKPDADGSTFHSNSFSFTDDTDAAHGIGGLVDRLDATGSPLPLLAPTAAEAAFIAAHRGDNCAVKPCGARWATWPGATVFDAEGGRALVSYGLVYAEPGAWNFRGVGQSLAVWSDFSQEAVRPEPGNCPDHPTLLFCEGEPPWGTALVGDGGLLYAFACDSSKCLLARVPPARALDRSAWQAWDGGAVALSTRGRSRQGTAPAAHRAAGTRNRDREHGATAALPALPPAHRTWQAERQGCGRRSARAGGIYLERALRTSRVVLIELPRGAAGSG